MGKFAWVTLATNDSYSMGALVLAHSLRRVNTENQLVVLITPGVTEAMKTQLSAVFNVVKLVDVLDSRDADNLSLLARPELGITFTKLHCWKLTEYEKCVFLDADTLVLQNSDELFEREELSAAPDAGWPDCFNSGVFVYKPSQQTFQALIEFALIHGSFDGGDQGLLNLFFSDWATKDIKKHLPFVYNMCSTATYSYLPAFKQYGAGLKIIHFIGAAKPWLQPFNTETGLVSVSGTSAHLAQFVQMWWDIFCAHVHPSLSTEMAGLAGALATVTLGTPLSVEQRALEEHLRRQGWEQGNIDYMGKDSFANIWQKICETLGTSAPSAPPEDVPAPVAPVAAPVYVSSVSISSDGQVDKTPPQANYAPVSALVPAVEASDSKDATKAPVSETATVAVEPKPSVTEVVPTDASVTPSATLETSKTSPEITSEPPAAQQPVTPADQPPKEKTEETAVSSTVPSAATTVQPTPSTPIEAPAPTAPALVPTTPTEAPAPTTPVPTTPVPAPTTPESVSITPVPAPPIPTGAPAPTAVPAPTAPAPVSTTPKETPAPIAPTEVPAPTTPAPAPTTPAPAPTSPVPAPIEAAAPTTPTLTEVPAPTTPAPAPISPVPAPTEAAAPTPTDLPAPSTPAPAPTTPAPAPTTPAPAPATPAPAPTTPPPAPTTPAPTTPAPAPSTPTLIPTEAPTTTPPTPAPAPTTPIPVPTTPAPTTPTPAPSTPTPTLTEAPAATPPTHAPAQTETKPLTPPVSTPSTPAKVEDTVPTPAAEPPAPQTPTVTEPTPPTSPPVTVEAPQLTKLAVEAAVPDTPPAGGSSQPSLADEPPVPPKRKGGSKAPQDSKNQKGGKPSKGKK